MTSQKGRFTFISSDMAIQLDLISKVNGISHEEKFFSKLSDDEKDKRTYGALLNASSQARLKEKADTLFETMKANGYLNDPLPFNVMMTLYMNLKEHEKVNTIINEMKEKNIALDLYSYNIWISNSAVMENIEEMERVLERMIADNRVNPNWATYSSVASMYIKAGDFEKAMSSLKEVELRVTGRDKKPFNYLLGLYASLGKEEEIYRIWNWYKSSFPSIPNMGYHAVLAALVKLNDIDGAQEIFDEWMFTTLFYDPRICNILMGWYARNGLADKSQELCDRLVEKGSKPKPHTWEILAEGYISEKEALKAVSYLKNAASYEGTSSWKPKPGIVAKLASLCREMNKRDEVNSLLNLLRNKGRIEEEEYKSLLGK